jgi:SpoVK/Ycf46/Vps4 family AAA+-type ATPase
MTVGILGVLAESTEGFSGADILIVCKDASMQPMRRVLQSLDGQPLDAQAIASKRVRGELLLPMVNTTFSILTRHFLRTHVHSKHI